MPQLRPLSGPVDTGWVALPLSSPWVDAAIPNNPPPGVRRIGSIVFIRGWIRRTSGTAAAFENVATIPVGFRPNGYTPLAAHTSNAAPTGLRTSWSGGVGTLSTAGQSALVLGGSWVAEN